MVWGVRRIRAHLVNKKDGPFLDIRETLFRIEVDCCPHLSNLPFLIVLFCSPYINYRVLKDSIKLCLVTIIMTNLDKMILAYIHKKLIYLSIF
jgi:hypothetical protein